MNKKILAVILLLVGIVITAMIFFLIKDGPIEPESKPDDSTETPIVPDDGDIVIPDKPDDPDPDYVSPDPSEPIEPIGPDEGDDDTTPPEDDQTPEDTSGFPKPGDGDQGGEDEVSDSDWQTFHNEGYKFEINYPDTHTVYRGVPDTKVFYVDVKNNPEHNVDGIFIKLADAANTAEDIFEGIEEENEQGLPLEILKDEIVYLFNIKVQKITVNTPMGYDSSHYLFSRNGINYELIIKNEDDLCEEIISSFKIIN